jgi:hypothetical protein
MLGMARASYRERFAQVLDGERGGYFTGFVILVPMNEARDPLLQLSRVAA